MASSRRRFAVALAFLCIGLCACSNPRPPIGRWEGVYEDAGVIIVARMEVTSDGTVRVSAPNAITSDAVLSASERTNLRLRLQSGLASSWPRVGPLALEFDGKVFRKPGGVAPQLEWDARAKRMTMIFYSGNRASVRVPLAAVESFGQS